MARIIIEKEAPTMAQIIGMHTVVLRNTQHGTIEIIHTTYDYDRGDVVYPFSLRDKYPGYNENRHVVVIPYAKAEALAEIERGGDQ